MYQQPNLNMSTGYFYTKIINIESVLEQLHSLDLSEEERVHLAALIDSSLHHAILDEVLNSLNEEDKKLFLKLLSEEGEHEKIMEFLNTKVEHVEDKIKKVADDLVIEIHKDIKQAREIK